MIPDDQFRLISGLLVSIPLSGILPFLPSSRFRYLYSFALGTGLQYYVYGTQLWLNFLQHIIVYLLMRIVGRKCGRLILVYTVISLFGYHIYRMVVDYGGWKLDISTIMMTMVCRYSLLAYAYEDGGTPVKPQSEISRLKQLKKQGKLTPQQKIQKQREQNRINQLPNLIDFLGYCQFVPTAITGSAFEYRHYTDYMNLTNGYDKAKINWFLTFKAFFQSFIYLAVFVVGHQMYFPADYMKTPQFTQNSFWFIVGYSTLSVQTILFKYYFGWKLSMSIIHICKFSSNYNEQTKIDTYNKINVVNVYVVTTSLHMRDKVANWNITVQQWLRKCVYQRCNFKNKTYSGLVTFLTSAFWHGTYGGYYFSFVFWFIHGHVNTLIFKHCQNQQSKIVIYYKKMGVIGQVLLWIVANVGFLNAGVYFQVLKVSVCIEILMRTYFAFPIGVILILIIFTVIKPKRNKDKTLDAKSD